MRKLSQADLLNESVWNAMKMGARGLGATVRTGVNLGKQAAEIVAPELTEPIRQGWETVKRRGREAKDVFLKTFLGRLDFIKKRLEEVGYLYDASRKPKRVSGGNYIIYAHKITGFNDKGKRQVYSPKGVPRAYPLLVNPQTGYISKDIRTAQKLHDASTKKRS